MRHFHHRRDTPQSSVSNEGRVAYTVAYAVLCVIVVLVLLAVLVFVLYVKRRKSNNKALGKDDDEEMGQTGEFKEIDLDSRS